MKLFKTGDMKIVKYCQSVFTFVIPSVKIAQKKWKICECEYHECAGYTMTYQLMCAVR